MASHTNDTGGKFTTGVIDTNSKFSTGVVDTGGKFAFGINETSGTSGKNLPSVSLIPVGHLDLRISPRIFDKIRNDPTIIFRSLG
jgi:hypothetical protein